MTAYTGVTRMDTFRLDPDEGQQPARSNVVVPPGVVRSTHCWPKGCEPTVRLIVALTLLTGGTIAAIIYMILEQRRHLQNLEAIGVRILVNGIRGKSSITRHIAGALRTDLRRVSVAKTTGSAAQFIYPGGQESPILRPSGIPNVIEQKHVIERATILRADYAVIECMAVDPDLQELNTRKLIVPTIGVISNVREDHLEEMGGPERTLDEVARSLCRSMPVDGVCVTAERERFEILLEEATKRGTGLIYADPDSVTEAEMKGFGFIAFPENVAIALSVAGLCGISRNQALAGMYLADPDPGVLRVDQAMSGGKRFAAVNLFAANDPSSTVMNVDLLLQRGLISPSLSVVINCRPDRIERNGQMGRIMGELNPQRIFLIGAPTKSATDYIPAHLRDRIVDLGGEQHSGQDLIRAISGYLDDDPSHALVMVGNIHGRGENLLAAITESTGEFDNELAQLLHDGHTAVMVEADNSATVVIDYTQEELLRVLR